MVFIEQLLRRAPDAEGGAKKDDYSVAKILAVVLPHHEELARRLKAEERRARLRELVKKYPDRDRNS